MQILKSFFFICDTYNFKGELRVWSVFDISLNFMVIKRRVNHIPTISIGWESFIKRKHDFISYDILKAFFLGETSSTQDFA